MTESEGKVIMDGTRELSASAWLDQNMDAILAFSIRAGAVKYPTECRHPEV